jgi:hypothetical protein
LASDLAAEIVSPDERPGELPGEGRPMARRGYEGCVGDRSGARRSARVPDDGDLTIVPADGSLDAAPVLPGFACSLAEVLR